MTEERENLFPSGEHKIEPGERVEVTRVSLTDSELVRIKAEYKQMVDDFKSRFPHLEIRLAEAYAIAQNNGTLDIMVPTYHTDGTGDQGCLLCLRVQRWCWDIDNDQLKRIEL
jgi:hypothetical protein